MDMGIAKMIKIISRAVSKAPGKAATVQVFILAPRPPRRCLIRRRFIISPGTLFLELWPGWAYLTKCLLLGDGRGALRSNRQGQFFPRGAHVQIQNY